MSESGIRIVDKTSEALPLISSSPANLATAAAASGSSAGIVIIGLWLLNQFHVGVPPEVATAFSSIIGSVVHWSVVKFGLPRVPS